MNAILDQLAPTVYEIIWRLVMSQLRLRLRFNPGREGTPLDKLGDFVTQSDRFLRSFASDLGVKVNKGELIAKEFRNESTSWDTAYIETVEPEVTKAGLKAMDYLTGSDPIEGCNLGLYSYETLLEFTKLGKGMDANDFFFIGLYQSTESKEPDWKKVSYRKISETREFLEEPFVTYGSVQGVLHALFTGPKPKFFHLRPLSGGDLIKCVFEAHQYRLIHEVTSDEAAVLLVYGDIDWDKSDQSIRQIDVKDVESVKKLTPSDFDALFGSMPLATGDQSTDQYISSLRDDDE